MNKKWVRLKMIPGTQVDTVSTVICALFTEICDVNTSCLGESCPSASCWHRGLSLDVKDTIKHRKRIKRKIKSIMYRIPRVTLTLSCHWVQGPGGPKTDHF